MRKFNARKLFYFVLIVSLVLFCIPQLNNVNASHKVFTDDFNDGNANGWIVVNDPDRTPCSAPWTVNNGMVGVVINQSSCTTNLMPNDTLWNNLGDNYIFELDMKFVAGTDHNVAFRFTPSTPSNDWYDLHFQSPGDFVLERINPGIYNTFVAGGYPNGQTYHIKIIVNGNNIKVYIGGVLVRDYTSTIDRFPTGRIALRAGTGADVISETYFDNIVVTSIDGSLNVPYYSQNADPWGPTEYDHTVSLGFSNTTMDRWGCAVTSAAMVLNYHGMTQFTDGTSLDPGSLNDWLKNNKGYLTGKGKGGSYSYINWNAIGKLTKELFNAGKSTVKLMHKRVYPSDATTTLLNDDLAIRKFPDILLVKNASTSSHFVVAKGILEEGNYAINDPEWNVATLSSFNTRYYQVDRYIPSQTDLSYIEVVVNPDVEFLVTDPLGRKTGIHVEGGVPHVFHEIPDASYAFEDPISNPDELGAHEQLGTGANVFLLPQPTFGDYRVTLSSTESATSILNMATFERDGNDALHIKEATTSASQDAIFNLHYSPVLPSVVDTPVTYFSAIDDVNNLWSLNLITKDHIARQLLRLLDQAQGDVQQGRIDGAFRRLDHFERILNRERGDGIAEDAYQVLLYDVNALKSSL